MRQRKAGTMSSRLDEIKAEIAREYGSTRQFDAAPWLARYPEWRSELEEFFAVFGPALAAAEQAPVSRWQDRGGVLRRMHENTRLIAAVRGADLAETELGARLADADTPLVAVPRGERTWWRETKTAIFTFIIDTFHRLRYGASGRFDANKSTYLMEVLLRLDLYRGFRPARLGMWNPNLYSIESDAGARGWITTVEGGKRFEPGPEIAQALELARQRLSDPELADQLGVHLARNHHRLELWGMVAYAASRLADDDRTVTAQAVLDVILTIPEWAWKDHLFPQIPQAMEHLIRLGLIPVDRVDLINDDSVTDGNP
jgi:hypothetical protein